MDDTLLPKRPFLGLWLLSEALCPSPRLKRPPCSAPLHRTLVVAGGVASNQYIRSELSKLVAAQGLSLVLPPPRWCTDNGVMIAWAGVERCGGGGEGLYDHQDSAPTKGSQLGVPKVRSMRMSRIYLLLRSVLLLQDEVRASGAPSGPSPPPASPHPCWGIRL